MFSGMSNYSQTHISWGVTSSRFLLLDVTSSFKDLVASCCRLKRFPSFISTCCDKAKSLHDGTDHCPEPFGLAPVDRLWHRRSSPCRCPRRCRKPLRASMPIRRWDLKPTDRGRWSVWFFLRFLELFGHGSCSTCLKSPMFFWGGTGTKVARVFGWPKQMV